MAFQFTEEQLNTLDKSFIVELFLLLLTLKLYSMLKNWPEL